MATRRVTVTVDEELLDFASEAVALGDVESVSSWISEAMAERRTKQRRLAVLSQLIAEYEDEHGVITAAEMAKTQQLDRDNAAAARARLASRS